MSVVNIPVANENIPRAATNRTCIVFVIVVDDYVVRGNYQKFFYFFHFLYSFYSQIVIIVLLCSKTFLCFIYVSLSIVETKLLPTITLKLLFILTVFLLLI